MSKFTEEGVQLPGQVNGNFQAVEPGLHSTDQLSHQSPTAKSRSSDDQQANSDSNQAATSAVMHQLSVMSLEGKQPQQPQAPTLSESPLCSKKPVTFDPAIQSVITIETYQYPESVITIAIAVVSSFVLLIFGCWWSLWCTYVAIVCGAASNTASENGNYGLANQKLSTAICCISTAWIAMIFGATFILGLTFGILYGY